LDTKFWGSAAACCWNPTCLPLTSSWPRVCHVGQQSSLLHNKISLRKISAMETFQSSWSFSPLAPSRSKPLLPPLAALWCHPVFCGVFQVQKPKKRRIRCLVSKLSSFFLCYSYR
jgi:hypothetical protein